MKRVAITGSCAAFTLAILIAGPAAAQTTSGAQSLNITPGARADAMGRAFVALPEDATANWWNPAALAWRNNHVFSLMHAQLVPDLASDVYYEYLGYSMHLPGWGGVGASIVYLGYGQSEATTAEGISRGVFSSYEFSPQVSIGTELMPNLAAGMTLKYVYVDLAPSWATPSGEAGTGDTFGADLAMLWRVKGLPGLGWPTNFGLNVQNLGPNIAYIDQDQSDPIGRNLKVGVGTRFLGGPDFDFTGLLSYDFNKSLVYSDEKPIHNVGAEISYQDFVALRTGYIYDKDGDIRDPTFGAGFRIKNFVADYASVPQARSLDRVNKVSISYQF
jgi:hypothetical protein